jgi:NADH-quinone oxidoreductase subunit M
MDQLLRRLCGVRTDAARDHWISDATALRLTSFLGLGTSLTGFAVALLLRRPDLALGWVLVILNGVALLSLLYGAILAWRQTDLKAMIAYSSISHMGVVLLGIAALNRAGLNGAATQMVAHGFSAGLLFLLIGLLYERTHRRQLADYGSLNRSAPRFALFIVFTLLASVGLPGSAGFIAELHVLIGAYARWGGWLVLLSLAVLISAAYALRAIRCLSTGPERAFGQVAPGVAAFADLARLEVATPTLLGGGILSIGFYPAPLLRLLAASVAKLAQQFGG